MKIKLNFMALEQKIIEKMLKEHFEHADINLTDTVGDQNHYRLEITSDAFIGKSRVARHQLVYKALSSVIGGDLHALSIQALTPDEQKQFPASS